MRINIEINESLILEIMQRAGIKTKKEAVHTALNEYLKMIKRKELAGMAGKIKWEGNLDEMRAD